MSIENDAEQRGRTYRYATLVRLTRDDPVNGHDEGDELFVEGKHPDGWSYNVLSDEKQGVIRIPCETVKTYEAPTRMGQEDILDYAVGVEKKERGWE